MAGGAKMRSDEVGVMSLVDGKTSSKAGGSTPKPDPYVQNEENIGI
ncbi:MAG: hypothetical protein SOW36_06265 [Porphyromonas sp.]|nr:hypothetical protein [Porphyromonas sp.]MDY3112221.1 hypothetical protein [Porphyromonas sp.]MDY4246081.1 hypothetical protein [Porphyromonas sp.]